MHYLPLPHPRKSSDASLQQSDQKTDQVTLLDLARAPHPQSLGLGIELGDVEIFQYGLDWDWAECEESEIGVCDHQN